MRTKKHDVSPFTINMETAMKAGSRHERPVVHLINAGFMPKAGYTFYYSVNSIWLIKEVPEIFLEKVK